MTLFFVLSHNTKLSLVSTLQICCLLDGRGSWGAGEIVRGDMRGWEKTTDIKEWRKSMSSSSLIESACTEGVWVSQRRMAWSGRKASGRPRKPDAE